MARYTGPKWKISRRENADVYGSETWRKRPFPPGMHSAGHKRPSNYAIQFREKQKVKRMYGLLEKQFRNIYIKASQSRGNTGVKLLQLLEMRLDNVVFQLGLAKTRNQARQFVTHGHVLVNSRKLDIPSYTVRIGDEISLKPNSINKEAIEVIKDEVKSRPIPEWLDAGKVKSEPTREMIDPSLNEQFIVELYSR